MNCTIGERYAVTINDVADGVSRHFRSLAADAFQPILYTREEYSRVTEVHSGGFEKRCTCHLAAAPLIIMRRAYLPSDDGGPTWRWARCAYSYFLFRRLLTGDSTDGTSAIVPPSWTCPASFLDDATRKGWREEKKKCTNVRKNRIRVFSRI